MFFSLSSTGFSYNKKCTQLVLCFKFQGTQLVCIPKITRDSIRSKRLYSRTQYWYAVVFA